MGRGDLVTTGQWAEGVRERYEAQVRLFEQAVPTHLGVLQESGPAQPWIIAMDGAPTRVAVRDHGLRFRSWTIRRPDSAR